MRILDASEVRMRTSLLAACCVAAAAGEQRGVVAESELEGLMGRCSTSREAALLVEAFRSGRSPQPHDVDVEELRQWWHVWQRLRPARAWSPGQLTLEPDVAYVADFRRDTGWQPVEMLPMPRHHAARIELANLDDFGHLRSGSWKEARITFRLLKSEVQPIDPPRRWNTIYTAEILRVE